MSRLFVSAASALVAVGCSEEQAALELTANRGSQLLGDHAWAPTNSPMTTTHANHMATLLLSGKVLLSGGDSVPYPAPSELYEPAAGTFAGTGAPGFAPYVSVRLVSGKVLVACSTGESRIAKLYDPVTGTFTDTGMTGGVAGCRSGTATLLPSGKVLIAGGQQYNGGGTELRLASAGLYDPTLGAYRSTGSMGVARSRHTATLLASGKVLVTGTQLGSAADAASSEIYDPATETWAPAGSMSAARAFHVAARLPSGKVLIAGGYQTAAPVTYWSTAEVFDPATGTFAPTGAMSVARSFTSASTLASGKVLVAGGAVRAGAVSVYHASTESYDEVTGTFHVAATMTAPRAGHAATVLISGDVVVTGGYNGAVQSSAEILRLAELGATCAASDDCGSGVCLQGKCATSLPIADGGLPDAARAAPDATTSTPDADGAAVVREPGAVEPRPSAGAPDAPSAGGGRLQRVAGSAGRWPLVPRRADARNVGSRTCS